MGITKLEPELWPVCGTSAMIYGDSRTEWIITEMGGDIHPPRCSSDQHPCKDKKFIPMELFCHDIAPTVDGI